MGDKHGKKPVPSGESRPASPQKPPPAPRNEKEAKPESPEDYSDPICVCEPEPYWQEIAERLKRDS